MVSTRKYFALALLLIFSGILLYLLRDYLLIMFAAMVISFFFFPLYNFFNKKYSQSTSASFVIILFLLLVFIPISAFGGLAIAQLNDLDFDDNQILNYEKKIESLTGKNVDISQEISKFQNLIKSNLKEYVSTLVSFTTSFFLSLFITCFFMFYLLIEHKNFLNLVTEYLPFSKKNSNYLLSESGNMVKAILIGQVITAMFQGLLGMLALAIVGFPNAIFWGFIMMILSLIPVVGAFLIWLPAGLLLILDGSIGFGIFVLVWGALIVSQVDNILRPKLINQFADIHPVQTFIGIFMGISAFDMIGLVLGPLLLALFSLCLKTYKKEYGVKNG